MEKQRRYIEYNNNSSDSTIFGIYVDGEQMIGTLRVHDIDFMSASAEIGLMIGEKDYWGKGLGTHTIKLISEYLLTETNLKNLTSGVNEKNASSIKAFTKNGYLEYARLRIGFPGRPNETIIRLRKIGLD